MRKSASREAAATPERRINQAFPRMQNCFWRELFLPFCFTSQCGIRDQLQRSKHEDESSLGGPSLPLPANEKSCQGACAAVLGSASFA